MVLAGPLLQPFAVKVSLVGSLVERLSVCLSFLQQAQLETVGAGGPSQRSGTYLHL